MSRLRGSWIIQQELGQLRSFASHLHASNNSIDEEAIFAIAAGEWLEGVKREVVKLFGPEKATEILSVWHHSKI